MPTFIKHLKLFDGTLFTLYLFNSRLLKYRRQPLLSAPLLMNPPGIGPSTCKQKKYPDYEHPPPPTSPPSIFSPQASFSFSNSIYYEVSRDYKALSSLGRFDP